MSPTDGLCERQARSSLQGYGPHFWRSLFGAKTPCWACPAVRCKSLPAGSQRQERNLRLCSGIRCLFSDMLLPLASAGFTDECMPRTSSQPPRISSSWKAASKPNSRASMRQLPTDPQQPAVPLPLVSCRLLAACSGQPLALQLSSRKRQRLPEVAHAVKFSRHAPSLRERGTELSGGLSAACLELVWRQCSMLGPPLLTDRCDSERRAICDCGCLVT